MSTQIAFFYGRSALVVQPSDKAAKEVVGLLKAIDFKTVRQARSAGAAKGILKKTSFDCVIYGASAEGPNCHDLVRFIRTHRESPNRRMPIIFMAREAVIDDRRAAINHGVNEVISQPLDCGELIVKLKAALSGEGRFIKTIGYVGPDRRHGERRQGPGMVHEDRGLCLPERDRKRQRVLASLPLSISRW